MIKDKEILVIGSYKIYERINGQHKKYIVDSGEYIFSKRFKKYFINKHRIIKEFGNLDDAKAFIYKKFDKSKKSRERKLDKLKKFLYLVKIREEKTNIDFIKVGFTRTKLMMNRFSHKHGYEGYTILDIILKKELPNAEVIEENIKNELNNRSVKKYRPILKDFSGYSECYDISNFELIKEVVTKFIS